MTREQKRANLAYGAVKQLEGKDKAKDYGSMALRFPALLRSAGLVQALAFVEARGKDAHRVFVRDFAAVLLELEDGRKPNGEAFNKLFDRARQASLPQYMRLTREALAVSDWFKRFAQSILDAEHEGA